MVQVFLVIFAALVLDLVQRRLLNRMARTLERTRNPWDDALLHAMRKPLGMLIWTLGITFAAYVVREETGAALFELAERPAQHRCNLLPSLVFGELSAAGGAALCRAPRS